MELVGLVCHVGHEPQGSLMLSDKTLRLHTNTSRITKRLLFVALQGSAARHQIEKLATGTSGSMKNIGQNDIRSIQIAIPHDLEEQNRITARFDSMSDYLSALYEDKEKLTKMKQGLMRDLLTGRMGMKTPKADKEAA
jgi:type I restriction enzyme S subunit